MPSTLSTSASTTAISYEDEPQDREPKNVTLCVLYVVSMFFVYSAFIAGGPLLSDRHINVLHSLGNDSLFDPKFQHHQLCDIAQLLKYGAAHNKSTVMFKKNCKMARVLNPTGWFLLIPLFAFQFARVLMLMLTRFRRTFFIPGLIWDFLIAVGLMAAFFCYDTGTKTVADQFYGGWLMFNQMSYVFANVAMGFALAGRYVPGCFDSPGGGDQKK
ncbi:hypothetical protein M3Y94_00658600 [Aphelenchoides besseyi]|nr:hypothetical protein M3Y94_00658600 [Aphelenchoides besseyi]KAI6231222.1 hypothetical protein M3Y95_00358500 [Aphelenchoides besseyi]